MAKAKPRVLRNLLSREVINHSLIRKPLVVLLSCWLLFKHPTGTRFQRVSRLKKDGSFYLLMAIELSMGKNISTLDALMWFFSWAHWDQMRLVLACFEVRLSEEKASWIGNGDHQERLGLIQLASRFWWIFRTGFLPIILFFFSLYNQIRRWALADLGKGKSTASCCFHLSSYQLLISCLFWFKVAMRKAVMSYRVDRNIICSVAESKHRSQVSVGAK